MPNKITLALVLFITLFLYSSNQALALTLTSVGSSAFTPQTSTQWWYSTANPVLSGTAAANSTVSLSINSVAYTTTANASGVWTYTPTTLTIGTHTVAITGDGTTKTVTLNIGQSAPTPTPASATSTSSATTLPVIGSTTTTIALLAFGALTIGSGLLLTRKV